MASPSLSVSKNYVFDTLSNETHVVGLSFEDRRSSHSAARWSGRSLVGAGARYARLAVFLSWQSYDKNRIELYLRRWRKLCEAFLKD